MAKPKRKGSPMQIDPGYYQLYQPVQGGGDILVGELVVVPDGDTVENWFLYTSGQGIYKWPSSTNTNQSTRVLYQNSTTTVEDVKNRLDQYGPSYKYIICNCVVQ